MAGTSAETIIEMARRQSGIDSFDDDGFREGLAIVAEEIVAHPMRTEAGIAMLEQMFAGNLATRLKIAQYRQQHPECAQQKIERPLFIMGLPRTGTTLTAQLLACDPARRPLLKWEMADPVPPARSATLRTDPRCLAMIDADREMLANADDATRQILSLQYEAPDGSTECVWPMAHDFRSALVETFLSSNRYTDWLISTDLHPTYEYHHRILQMFHSTAPGEWMLKAPSHLVGLDALLDVYPDARLVWCHRDPFRAAASTFSLQSKVQSMSLSGVDFDYLRSGSVKLLSEHIGRGMALQDRSERDPFHHIYYHRLIDDPIGTVLALYDALGDEFTPEAETAMLQWLAKNPQGRFGRHSYSLEKFGVDRDDLAPVYAEYLERFDVAMED